MKVFISWSGEPSESIARALRDWLPTVVQHVEPWMSGEEIKSGTRWNDQVTKALDQTDFGIVCVTASNQHQPWLMFEAGALAKHLEIGRVVPLCIDLAPAEVTGPLEAFQGRRLDQEGMRRLVQDIMAAGEKPLPPAQVSDLFEAMWERLELKVDDAKRQSPGPQNPQRTIQEMLEELVERVRRIDGDYVPLTLTNSPSRLQSGPLFWPHLGSARSGVDERLVHQLLHYMSERDTDEGLRMAAKLLRDSQLFQRYLDGEKAETERDSDDENLT